MDFNQLLLVVMAGVPAGILEYVLLNKWPWYKDNPDPVIKRAVAYGVAALLGLAAWGIALAMGYLPTPADARAYIEQAANVLITVGLATFGASQAVHMRDLSAKG